MGVNTLTGDVAGNAVDEGALSIPTNATGQSVTYNVTLINSYEELNKSIGISVEASGHYGLFSGEGKFQYSNEVKFNSQSTFLLARVVVENAFTQCEEPKLKPAAAELIRLGKMEAFHQRYGDGFVRGMQTGGEYFAIFAITSTTREEQETIGAELHAKYGNFLASAEVSASSSISNSSKSSETKIQITTYQRGGKRSGISLTNDVQQVLQRLKDFPSLVAEDPVPYYVQVASYNTLELPDGPNFVDIQNQKEALKQHARMRLKLLTYLNDLEFVQDHPEYFIDPPPSKNINGWSEQLTEQLNQLTQQASRCVNDQSLCSFFSYREPEGFSMPPRKVEIRIKVPDVCGLPIDVATLRLQEIGLRTKEKFYILEASHPLIGKVFKQAPVAFSEVPLETEVEIFKGCPPLKPIYL